MNKNANIFCLISGQAKKQFCRILRESSRPRNLKDCYINDLSKTAIVG